MYSKPQTFSYEPIHESPKTKMPSQQARNPVAYENID